MTWLSRFQSWLNTPHTTAKWDYRNALEPVRWPATVHTAHVTPDVFDPTEPPAMYTTVLAWAALRPNTIFYAHCYYEGSLEKALAWFDQNRWAVEDEIERILLMRYPFRMPPAHVNRWPLHNLHVVCRDPQAWSDKLLSFMGSIAREQARTAGDASAEILLSQIKAHYCDLSDALVDKDYATVEILTARLAASACDLQYAASVKQVQPNPQHA